MKPNQLPGNNETEEPCAKGQRTAAASALHRQRATIRHISAGWILPLLLLLAAPAGLQAQFSYSTNNDSIIIEHYTGPGGSVVIPGIIDGLPVTLLHCMAFYGCTNVTSVVIPDTVTVISGFTLWPPLGPFMGCSALTNVTIGKSVQRIGGGGFFWMYCLGQHFHP